MKTFYNIIVILAIAMTLASCGGAEQDTKTPENADKHEGSAPQAGTGSYDPKHGEGKFTLANLALSDKLDPIMAKAGETTTEVKCSPCHKLTDEKLVGPGWKGVTTRRAPDWIMNFITNPDPMIDKDPAVQAMLEMCMVRMPNQSLSDKEARDLLEFMRKNDGLK